MGDPLYKLNDAIYLEESATLGFLESYRVDGIEYDTESGQWLYLAVIRMNGPETDTVIDSYNLRKIQRLRFGENKITDICGALDLAIAKLQANLTQLTLKLDLVGESEIKSESPKFSIDDVVYLRESAILSFIEQFTISNIRLDNSTLNWHYQVTRIDANQRLLRDTWFEEDELLVLSQALDLAILRLTHRLQELTAMKESMCS